MNNSPLVRDVPLFVIMIGWIIFYGFVGYIFEKIFGKKDKK